MLAHHRFRTALCAVALLVTPLPASLSAADGLPPGVVQVSPSEYRIDRELLAGRDIDAPMPQGLVDVNPPWLHVRVPLDELVGEPVSDDKRAPSAKKIAAQEKWNRRYYFKLSQDPQLKREVIESGPKRWSFFSPFKRLATGTWYWTYGVANSKQPDRPIWTEQTYSFVIPADAFAGPIPPSADVVLEQVRKHKTGPIVTCAQEDVGKLMPTTRWPELAKEIQENCENALREGDKPIDIVIDDTKYPDHMKDPKEVYFTSKMYSEFVRRERLVDALLRGYLLTGNLRMKELGVKRAVELEEMRLTRKYTILGREIAMKERVTFYNTVPMLMIDAFFDDMTPPQQNLFIAQIENLIREKGAADGPDMHEQLEHTYFSQHSWQMKLPNLLMGSLVLSRRVPEMEEWFRYAYELWVYRNPALSRNDGGSIDGNGYLGVHEEPQTHINWTLYRFTGFNYFASKRWFDNLPVYMSYVNAAGNMAAPYCDGGDNGASLHYLSEILTYLRPENPLNLWRFKSEGSRDVNYYAADLYKGNKAWDMLSVWKKFPTAPDLSTAQPPKELAGAFRDIGIVAMHTDMSGPKDDLMVNLSSALYGSRQHLHPSQNAFCVAYGGQPLFWRTGYYNGGSRHDMLSYKCSRAHNTIMADGMMQGFDLSAYGWIPRFATSKNISYCLGDASRAYTGTFPKFERSKDTWKPEEGMGPKPGVTRFRRHLLMLRPSHILVYDELEAEKAIPWTFMLHGLTPITQLGNTRFTVANDHAQGVATLLCAHPVTGSVTDQFFAPAVDEENKRGGKNPPNWHVSITTKERLAATRFLTVIEVSPGKTAIPEVTQRALADGKVELMLGAYRVTAQLDPSKPSFLEAIARDGTSGLVTGQGATALTVGEQTFPAKHQGGTLLWDQDMTGKPKLQEVIDQLPDVLLYGNRF